MWEEDDSRSTCRGLWANPRPFYPTTPTPIAPIRQTYNDRRSHWPSHGENTDNQPWACSFDTSVDICPLTPGLCQSLSLSFDHVRPDSPTLPNQDNFDLLTRTEQIVEEVERSDDVPPLLSQVTELEKRVTVPHLDPDERNNNLMKTSWTDRVKRVFYHIKKISSVSLSNKR